ncbi:hypothetical protein B0H67DRAFT_645538 [Lasiosphaeris hirsuta]|uniref:Uncharacterized protein n=1 Tax=Lasiosphaeris hirsuta TaxID=260670 RepID=A0AA40AHD2_9PEZI|nr:hypothetical protein B0H67DRAFT_645538 [Lasiosphaeris hirsuta]
MSVFSMIQRSRQAAKERRTKQAESKKEEDKTPYRHVPKHAAIDALSGGPASFRDGDRPAILEQNQRRSMMTASGVGMSNMSSMSSMSGMLTPVHDGLPRAHSALSRVSYPSISATPVVRLSRNYSYNSMASGWFSPAPVSGKGKEVERIIDSGCASRSSSKGSLSRMPLDGFAGNKDPAIPPMESSSCSNSSQGDLEIRPVKPRGPAASTNIASSKPFNDAGSFHRLHPGHSRRGSGSASGPNVLNRRISSASLAAGIPLVSAPLPMQYGSATSFNPSAASSISATSVAPTTAKVPSPVPHTLMGDNSDATNAFETPYQDTTTLPRQRGWASSKATRFAELETMLEVPNSKGASNSMMEETREETRATSVVPAQPTDFDQSSFPAPQAPILPPPKTRKLSKMPSANNKSRWSLRSSKSPAVAA